MGRRVRLADMGGGRVGMHHDMVINGMNNDDEAARQHIFSVVRLALPEAYIDEDPLTAVLEPVVYWTSDGIQRQGRYVLTSRNTLTVRIDESPEHYPLLIDPTFVYGGSIGSDGAISGSDQSFNPGLTI